MPMVFAADPQVFTIYVCDMLGIIQAEQMRPRPPSFAWNARVRPLMWLVLSWLLTNGSNCRCTSRSERAVQLVQKLGLRSAVEP